MHKMFQIVCGGVALLFILSCIPEIIPYESMLDTPARHYKNGMKLFQAGKIEASKSEFYRSLEIDQEFAPGFVGLGLISGLRGDYSDAIEKMVLADLYTRNRSEIAMVHVGFMRIYLMGREKISTDWLKNIEEHFEKAVLLAHEIPEPYYYMGFAYKAALELDKAAEQFVHVMNMKKDFVSEASEQLSTIQEMRTGS
ncbi:MAG: hypothetical protein R6U27_14940 [Desulfobacterales bacterium]